MKIFYFIWSVWFLFEIFLARKKRSSKDSRTEVDKGSLNVLWLAILAGISLSVILMMKYYLPISNKMLIPYLGLLFIVLGLIFRIIAIKKLANDFTVDVSIGNNQELCTTGIYGLVRHPAYAGSIISFIGLGLSLNNWISLLVIATPVIAAFLYRIKIEEQILIEKFGKKYLEYRQKTKKIIPFIF